MIDNKVRRILMIVVGGYLAYLGFGLAKDVWGSGEKNTVLFLCCAVLFLAIGVFAIVMNIKGLIREQKEADEAAEEDARREEENRSLVQEEEFESETEKGTEEEKAETGEMKEDEIL